MEYRTISKNYEVSDTGIVRSLDRVDGNNHFRKGQVLKSHANKKGYITVSLSIGGVHKTHRIHTLVAQAFIGDRPEGYQINHIDGDKTNNNASNLEYCTQSSNMRHAYDTGLSKPVNGERNGRSSLTDKQVMEIMAIGSMQLQHTTAMQYGVSRTVITNITNGKTWKHITTNAV